MPEEGNAAERAGGRVWAGNFDPRQSNIVLEVAHHLLHPMMQAGMVTPGEEVLRERDRKSFSKALAQLNDGLSDLCHNMRQSVEGEEDHDRSSWDNKPLSARSSNLSKAPSQQRGTSSARQQSKGSVVTGSEASSNHKYRLQRTPSTESSRGRNQPLPNKIQSENSPATGNSSFQHDVWVNDRVETLMKEVREAQAKLRPKLQDRAALAELGLRLEGLERGIRVYKKGEGQ